MPAAGWEQRWRGNRRAENRESAPDLAGLEAEPLDPLLHLGARALLATSGADRTGLWLFASRRGEPGPVCVADSSSGPIREEWKRLDLAAPFAQAAMENFGTVRVETVADEPAADETTANLGPLDGLHSVVWLPLRAGERLLGLGMVGYARPPGNVNRNELRSLADGIARAVRQSRDSALEDRATSYEALRKVIRESGEWLVAIDGGGRIVEASRAAETVLFAPRGLRDGAMLEDLFFPVARDAVREWRCRLPVPASAVAQRREALAPVFEAELERGGIVRMRVQSEFPGAAGDAPRWLLRLEEQGAQQKHREIEERLESELAGLLDSIESGVLLVDPGGRIVIASERLAAIFGMDSRRILELGTIDALIDRLAYHFARPAEAAARWREQVRQGDEASWDELEFTRPSRKVIERFARPLYKSDGAQLGRLEVYRDITGQRLIQSKLLQTEKMAALGQLVSGIAHELNNPLTSIQGYAQLLQTRRSSSERAADTQRILQEAGRAGRIVKNLLLFAREAKSERRAVDLNEIIERTLSLRSYELKLENIETELALDPNLPSTLADSAQLGQVVLNLIVNAEQAIVMAQGEEPRTGHILLRTRRLAGDRVALDVSDDGPGISPEIASRIFDPFFTTKPPGIGTGLGLSIVYGVVQEHGGEVSVDSVPGRGATLTVELPVTGSGFAGEPPAIRTHPAAVTRLPALVRTAAKRQVLVVEDEPTVAELIGAVLTDEGYRVDILLDSRAALGRLEEKSYALVICDMKMPYVDGPGLYRALMRRENPMQYKMLFVTGDTMGPRTLEFLKASALPYLAKPFLVDELQIAVRRALGSEPAGNEASRKTRRSRVAGQE